MQKLQECSNVSNDTRETSGDKNSQWKGNSRGNESRKQAAPLPNYKPIRVIGNGAFGYVFEAIDVNRNQKVALKRTQKAGNIVSREYEVLSLLENAPNIVQLVEFFYTVDQKQRIIQNTVMEYCDGSLEDTLRKAEKTKSAIQMDYVKHYIWQVFNGLKHMHEKDIAHRDLKPENILLSIPGHSDFETSDPLTHEVKICDLGAAKVLNQQNLNTPYVVSRYYRAPELILGSNQYDCSIDVWSVGCILFELITRTPLFPGDAEGLQILEQAQIKGMPTPSELDKLSAICEQPVIQLLQRNQDFGPVDLAVLMTKNCKSPYEETDIKNAADLVNKCLKWVPTERISAAASLNHPFFGKKK